MYSPHPSVLMIDCKQDLVSLIGEDFGPRSAKWGSPVIVPLDTHMYQEAHLNNFGSSSQKLPDLNQDVVIICPPLNASHVLVIDPRAKRTCLAGDEFSTDNFKYDGACLGSDGAVYCAPSCATQFLRIEVIATLVEEVFDEKTQNMRSVDTVEDEEDADRPWYERENSSGASSSRQGDSSAVQIIAQRMKNFLHVSGTSSIASPNSRKMSNKVYTASNNNTSSSPRMSRQLPASPRSPDRTRSPSPTSPLIQPKRRSVTFDFGDNPNDNPNHNHHHSNEHKFSSEYDSMEKDPSEITQGIKHRASSSRLSYKWPPDIVCSYHGAERLGNFKFGGMVLSADGKAAIAIPMNVN
jgi:hypothetical protein